MAAGLSQIELADALGVQQATVSMWENGTRSPHPTRIKCIAAVLGIEPDELLLGPIDPTTVTLGAFRQATGLSQAALAARLEVRPSVVSGVEIGRYWPEALLAQWCALLGITSGQFRDAWWMARQQRHA